MAWCDIAFAQKWQRMPLCGNNIKNPEEASSLETDNALDGFSVLFFNLCWELVVEAPRIATLRK